MDSGNFCSFGVIPANPSMEDNAILSLVSNPWVGSRGAGSTDGIESMQLKSEEVLLSPGGKTIKISKLDSVLPCSCSFSVKDYKWHQLVSRLKTTVQTAGQCFKVFWDRWQSKRVANERAVKNQTSIYHFLADCRDLVFAPTLSLQCCLPLNLSTSDHLLQWPNESQTHVKCDSILLWFCFTPLCHCSITSQDSLKQSDSKLVATRLPAFSRVFPHLRRFSWFYVEFSLAPWDIFLFSDWLIFVFGFTTLNRNTSRNSKKKTDGRGGENDNQE